ncbi:unnamed protein product [Rhizophagus irregularis]|nr:unnamed protein product [Rhizophagus irregularis]
MAGDCRKRGRVVSQKVESCRISGCGEPNQELRKKGCCQKEIGEDVYTNSLLSSSLRNNEMVGVQITEDKYESA